MKRMRGKKSAGNRKELDRRDNKSDGEEHQRKVTYDIREEGSSHRGAV